MYLCKNIETNMEKQPLNRLKIVLAEKNIQNKWIAEQLGGSWPTVSKWVNNPMQHNMKILGRLAELPDIDYT